MSLFSHGRREEPVRIVYWREVLMILTTALKSFQMMLGSNQVNISLILILAGKILHV